MGAEEDPIETENSRQEAGKFKVEKGGLRLWMGRCGNSWMRVSGVEESKCLKVEESQEAEKDPTGDGRKGREHGSSGAGAKEQGT